MKITSLTCKSCFASLETDTVHETVSIECEYCGQTHIYEVEQESMFNQEGQTVHGLQANVTGNLNVERIGTTMFIGGDVVRGDKYTGDKVGGRQTDGDLIIVGDIKDEQGLAIGRGASATSVTYINYKGQ